VIEKMRDSKKQFGVQMIQAGAKTECSVCLSTNVRDAFQVQSYDFALCEDCTHLFVATPILPGELASAYDAGYYVAPSSSGDKPKGYEDYVYGIDKRIVGFRQRMTQIGRFVEKPGRLLDYGCAVGLFVKVAVEAGWRAQGYERSPWAANYGRSQFGLDIIVGDGQLDSFGANSFDVVTLWDVLEHLQNPRYVLNLVAKWMARGGVIALNTVNSSSLGARIAGPSWRHIAPPYHLQLYSKRSLVRLLAEFGFKTVWMQGEGVLFSAAKSEQPALGRGKAQLESLVRYWRIRPLVTFMNLLDEIAIFAVKV
jgi:hypothetical protein